MATPVPSRVQVQSFTFIAPMADTLHYLMQPANVALVSFGMMALAGVVAGSFLYAMATGTFRLEWFASVTDFVNHAIGAALMGIGGVLAMGCTIGQGVTGMSTLALGAVVATLSMMAGAAAAMKVQYWLIMRGD